MQPNLMASSGGIPADLLNTVTKRGIIYIFTVDDVAAFETLCDDRGLVWEREHATFRVSLPPTREDLLNCGIPLGGKRSLRE